jgi:hypothetical protein
VTTEQRNETVDERLARLRDATHALAPPPDLADRLARGARASPTRQGVAGIVLPFGRTALVAAALAAAASVAFLIQSERTLDESISRAESALWEP